MPKNFVQNGFYMAVGNAGLQREEAMVRLYFNVTPEGAVAVMTGLTERLNQRGFLLVLRLYIIQLIINDMMLGCFILAKQIMSWSGRLWLMFIKKISVFKPEIPLFTLELAPGLGLAEEPDKKFGSEESFGMNRCQIIANGLLMAWQQEDNSATGRITAISEQFSGLGIDWRVLI